jgi:hypothetical protein
LGEIAKKLKLKKENYNELGARAMSAVEQAGYERQAPPLLRWIAEVLNADMVVAFAANRPAASTDCGRLKYSLRSVRCGSARRESRIYRHCPAKKRMVTLRRDCLERLT